MKDFMAEKRDAENNATAARLLVSAVEMDCLESAVFESTFVDREPGSGEGPWTITRKDPSPPSERFGSHGRNVTDISPHPSSQAWGPFQKTQPLRRICGCVLAQCVPTLREEATLVMGAALGYLVEKPGVISQRSVVQL
jgi:hypothetical protein